MMFFTIIRNYIVLVGSGKYMELRPSKEALFINKLLILIDFTLEFAYILPAARLYSGHA